MLKIAILCLAGNHMAIAQTVTAVKHPSVAELREKNAGIGRLIRTLVLVETVDESLNRSAAVTEHEFSLPAGTAEARQELLQNAQARNLSPERQAELLAGVEAQLDSQREHLEVVRLNDKRLLKRTVSADLLGNRLRRDDVDQRNHGELVRAHGLSASQRRSLDKTGSLISVPGKPEVRLHTPLVGKLATLQDDRILKREQILLSLGVIPESLLSSAASIDSRPVDGRAEMQLVGRSADGGMLFEIRLSPADSYAMTSYAIFDKENLIEEFSATDFREVGGVRIPFETRWVSHRPIQRAWVTQRRVESVKINNSIQNELFDVPADYRVTDLRSEVAAGK